MCVCACACSLSIAVKDLKGPWSSPLCPLSTKRCDCRLGGSTRTRTDEPGSSIDVLETIRLSVSVLPNTFTGMIRICGLGLFPGELENSGSSGMSK